MAVQNTPITIGNTQLFPLFYRTQPVITLAMMDKVHGRPEGTARKRFNDHKEKLVVGEDFYNLNQPSEIRTLGLARQDGSTPANITLLTETGYLLLVKSFTDELAWQIQRQLVKAYFAIKQQPVTFNDPPLSQGPMDRVKQGLLNEYRKMSKSLAQAYLIECGVTPAYVQQQLTALGDAIPPAALIYQDDKPAEQRDTWDIACDEIRAAIKKAGKRGLTMREMKRQAPFSKYTPLQLGKVLSYLEYDDGTIALANVNRNRTAYVAIEKEAKPAKSDFEIACDEIREAIMSAGKKGVTEQEMNCQPFSRYTKDTLGKILDFLVNEEKSIRIGRNTNGTRVGYVATTKEAM